MLWLRDKQMRFWYCCCMKLTYLLFYIPTGKLKAFMNFNNCFVMFCLFIYLCLNEQNVKKSFMIKFYIPHLEN